MQRKGGQFGVTFLPPPTDTELELIYCISVF